MFNRAVWFIFLFSFLNSLFADDSSYLSTLENDPSALIEGRINALTGRPLLYEEDLIIQGVEPIRIARTYVDQMKGDWRFAVDSARVIDTDKPYRWVIWEKDRCPILYKRVDKVKIGKEKYIRCEPSSLEKGVSNTSRGKISSRTNLKNNRVLFDEKFKNLIVHSADGTVRTYKKISNSDKEYQLLHEQLPNGNWILYDYKEEEVKKDQKQIKLISIRTTNPSKDKTYARADFVYEDRKGKNKHFWIIGSDGQKVEYRFRIDESGRQTGSLEYVVSSAGPDQSFGYLKYKNTYEKFKGNYTGAEEYRIHALAFPMGRQIRIDYYKKEHEEVPNWKVHLDGDDWNAGRMFDDPRRNCVKTISTPVGNDANIHVTHSFIYEPASGKSYFEKTSVYDVEGNKIDYFSDWYSRIKRIERYSKEGRRLNAEAYEWGFGERSGFLISKMHLDANLTPLFFTRYLYDDRGNVLEERFCGNLSGKGPPISLDKNGFPIDSGLETHSKKFRYSHEEPNLLIEEQHDSGLRIVYTYLPGTDLPLSKLTYDRKQLKLRQFFDYNPDRILICEIEDDGSSTNPHDFSDVVVRIIRQMTPLQSGPYIGLPHTIEEKFWEKGQEFLLRKTVFTYTTGAKIAKKEIYDAKDELRFSLETKYDDKGRPIEQTNAIGQIEKRSYDLCGNQKSHSDFSGRVSNTIDYDFSNRPVAAIQEGDDGIRLQTSFTYDLKHNLVLETDAKGHETRRRYDALGQCTETHLPKVPSELGELLSPFILQQFDSVGNQTLKVDGMGNATNITYTSYGKPILVVHPDGTKEESAYFLDGNLKTYINPKGVTTSYTYDYLGRPLRKAIFSSQGILLSDESFVYRGKCLISKTDAEGYCTLYQYDGAGRKISEERNGENTTFTYDSLCRLHKVQKGDLVAITEHDLLDRILEERNESLSGEILRIIAYEYDQAGNQKTVIKSVAGKKTYERRTYDSLSRLIEKIDPLGQIEQIAYHDFFKNTFDQKVLQKIHTDPMGLKTIETFNPHDKVVKIEKNKDQILSLEEKTYNLNGLLTFQVDTIYAPSFRQVHTRWTYDQRNRLKTLTEADGALEGKTTQYAYTPTGELAQKTKPDGTQLIYDYNHLGFLTSLTSSDGTVQHRMSYNRLGHLVQSNQGSRTVDAEGRILTETFLGRYSIQNEYDKVGRRIKCRIPTANCLIEYEYNPLDLIKVSRKSLIGETLYSHEFVSYDQSGNLLEERLIGSKGAVLHFPDPLSRKTAVQSALFNQEIIQFDPVGNIREMKIQDERISYNYDDLYQLTSESGLFAHSYLYDALYNRLQKDGAIYQINALNQILSDFIYDQNGNPILHGDTAYTYDALDRLIRIESPSLVQTFTYDSEHRRLSKTTIKNGQTERLYFLYDDKNDIGSLNEELKPIELRILGATPHAELNASIAIELGSSIYTESASKIGRCQEGAQNLGQAKQLNLEGLAMQTDPKFYGCPTPAEPIFESLSVYAPIHDLQGNLALLIPLDAEDPTYYRYSAFGEEKRTGSVQTPWRFSSKRCDDETGLIFYGRRYYIPSYGRWLTPDPAGFVDGINLYAFVHNGPLTHFDEYGLLDYGQSEPSHQSSQHLARQFTRQLASHATHSFYDSFLLPFRTDKILTNANPHNPRNDHLAIDAFFDTHITMRNELQRAAGLDFTYGHLPTPGKLISSGSAAVSSIRKQFSSANPFTIKFSQPTVTQNFSDGNTINDLIQGLRSGKVKATQIPPIRVVDYKGNLVTLDNRRLVAFQNAKIESIPIEHVSLGDQTILRELRRKYNPINNGSTIVIIPNSIQRKTEEILLRSNGKIK